MKLEYVLENLNSLEKNSFLKIVDSILSNNPRNIKSIEKILNDPSKDLKNIDNINISKVFGLIEDEFTAYILDELSKPTSQFDILADIISRDGNSILKLDWFARLYEKEIIKLQKKLKEFDAALKSEKSEITQLRKRDYQIYFACLDTAYQNDVLNNQENKITTDEKAILQTLSKQLSLSQEEVKLLKYLIIPLKKADIDSIINELKSSGLVFFSKKTNTIYIPDEIVRLIRKARGKEVADKFFRRVLRLMKESQINLICKHHNIDSKLPVDSKIKEIINVGAPFTSILIHEVHKPGTKVTDKKKFINDLCDRGLKISPPIKGTLIEEKTSNLIKYFEEIEKDDKVGISIDGYEKLLSDLDLNIKSLNSKLRAEFELQSEATFNCSHLLERNIKPQDVLELLTDNELTSFCQLKAIKTRGDMVFNILEAYKDTENLHLENYENIGFRNLNLLKENGIDIKEAELGSKFEDLTKKIFMNLGLNVDESLSKKINTAKDKVDILINLGNNEIILVECKTSKESGYNKFSSVSRQLKSYVKLISSKDYKVVKSLLVAPEFSDEFIKDCGLDYELNLSLITASSLLKIMNGFKSSRHKQFPHNILMRDVLIQEERVLKAIVK